MESITGHRSNLKTLISHLLLKIRIFHYFYLSTYSLSFSHSIMTIALIISLVQKQHRIVLYTITFVSESTTPSAALKEEKQFITCMIAHQSLTNALLNTTSYLNTSIHPRKFTLFK